MSGPAESQNPTESARSESLQPSEAKKEVADELDDKLVEVEEMLKGGVEFSSEQALSEEISKLGSQDRPPKKTAKKQSKRSSRKTSTAQQQVSRPDPAQTSFTIPTPAVDQTWDRRGAATSIVDEPTTQDYLNRKALVESLSAMIASPQQATPFTIALLGDWGAGKSSVMEQIESALTPEESQDSKPCEPLFARFNAWEYEHTDNIRAGLAHEVVQALTKGFGYTRRWRLKIAFAWSEHRSELIHTAVQILLALIAGGSLVSLLAFTDLLETTWVDELVQTGVVAGAFGFIVHLLKSLRPVLDHPLTTRLQTYLRLPDYGQHLGMIPVMKEHLRKLCILRGVTDEDKPKHRLVVCIDDLDRCGHDCIVQTLDAIRLVMDIPNVITMIAIDFRIAFAAVARHYRELGDEQRTPEAIARDYLGKIIQLPIELSQPSDMKQFIRARLFPSVKSKEVEQFREEFLSDREMSEKDGETGNGGEGDDQNIQAKDVPELMHESTHDCALFERWTERFGVTNPRRLLRLRNTYRLLTQIDSTKEGNRLSLLQDEKRMAMLFWLDWLFSKAPVDQPHWEASMRNSTADSESAEPFRIELDKTTGPKALHHLFESEWDEYNRMRLHVGRFVLPWTGDGLTVANGTRDDDDAPETD